eukprot:236790_1
MAAAESKTDDDHIAMGYEDFKMLPNVYRTPTNILKHLPFKKFKKPSWTKPPCVILSCGSFSPPTYLHLRIMEEARDFLAEEFEVLGGILSPTNDQYAQLHKPSLKAANGTHRIAMCELATQSSDWIGVSDFEVKLDQWARVALVIESYGKAIDDYYKTTDDDTQNDQAEKRVHMKFLCGSDLLQSMRTPNLWRMDHQEIILGEHGVVVVERDGHRLDDEFFNAYQMFAKHRKNIHAFYPPIKNSISSTKVRDEIKKNNSIKYLTPDAVIEYIEKHKLYSSGQ